MKVLPLSALASTLLVLPLAAQTPAAPPAPPAQPPSAPVQVPPAPPAAAPVETAAAPHSPLTLADTDCTALDDKLRRISAASHQGQQAIGYDDGAFPYSRISSYECYNLKVHASQIGRSIVRISISLTEGACNEKNWPQLLKALGLPADVPRPNREKSPREGNLWVSPQPGRNWVVFRYLPDGVAQLIVGRRAVYDPPQDLVTDIPSAAGALEDFRKILEAP